MAMVQRIQHVSVPMPPGGGEQARTFYGKALGLPEVKPPADLRSLNLVWFRIGDTGEEESSGDELHCFTEPGLHPNTPAQHLCFQVGDLAQARARLEENGIAIEETIAIGNRPRFFVHDPFGNLIEIVEITGPYSQGE